MESKKDFGSTLTQLLDKPLPNDQKPILVLKKRKEVVDSQEEKIKKKKRVNAKKQRKLLLEKDHIKAEYNEVERKLIRIATRGVVTLFNAVSKQQFTVKTNEKEVDKKKKKKKEKLKQLDGSTSSSNLLSQNKSGHITGQVRIMAAPLSPVAKKVDSKPTEKTSNTWQILTDDYMMGAKLKDWDQDLDNDSEDK